MAQACYGSHYDSRLCLCKKYNLEIKQVLEGDISLNAMVDDAKHIKVILLMDQINISEAIINYLAKQNLAKKKFTG